MGSSRSHRGTPVTTGDELGETKGQLWLAGAGWALLTLVLMALLGVGLPVLLAGTLSFVLPRTALLIGGLVGMAMTIATAAALLWDTRRRYAARPRLLRALTIGYAVAMVISVPLLLLWFGLGLTTVLSG